MWRQIQDLSRFDRTRLDITSKIEKPPTDLGILGRRGVSIVKV
jgi:hypothetical protein